ncbi:hypothetical protein OEZ85_012405 [Tetradesmus obliquus]|uniref:Peptidase S33 tripeptidyl aminopeptidase-like C-terminal domain-containing protein n=1 Tax=Tetradesmus obliquus TaxID=3088 RepID=A0ABY8TTC2_TETOB|nr:hypothetical protein OEZ85_012405 [Tetradesmus obliquus]
MQLLQQSGGQVLLQGLSLAVRCSSSDVALRKYLTISEMLFVLSDYVGDCGEEGVLHRTRRDLFTSQLARKHLVPFFQLLDICGLKLAGTLTSSSNPGSQQCIIMCHGYQSYREGFQLPALAAALAEAGAFTLQYCSKGLCSSSVLRGVRAQGPKHAVKTTDPHLLLLAGYNSFRFDFSGNGDSEGAFRFANYWGEVAEIHAAKQHLQQHEGQAVIGLLGHSKAGGEVVLYASSYDDIPLVVNVAGRFWMDRGVTMRFGEDVFERAAAAPVEMPAQRDDGHTFTWLLTKEDLDERMNLDMAAAAAGIKRSKVLTIHGTADSVIPIDDGRQMAESIAGSSLVEVEGADHNFRASEQVLQQLIAAVLGFLQEGKAEGWV